jgi:hypothetical protein
LTPEFPGRPLHNVKIIAGLGLQWRQTTADAVYVIPDKPVSGTAGQPGRWTGTYEQLRTEWAIGRLLQDQDRRRVDAFPTQSLDIQPAEVIVANAAEIAAG